MSSGKFEIFFHVHCTQIHTARDTDMVSGTVCKICEHEKIRENKKKSKTKQNTTATTAAGEASKQVVLYPSLIYSIIILY